MTLRDPKPGRRILRRHRHRFRRVRRTCRDGDGQSGSRRPEPRPFSAEQREAIEDAGSPRELIDPADEIDARRFPTLHRLAAGLAQDRWEQEFETGLAQCSTASRFSWPTGRTSGEADAVSAAIAAAAPA